MVASPVAAVRTAASLPHPFSHVVRNVATTTGITEEQILSKLTTRDVVRARALCCHFLTVIYDRTGRQIGEYLSLDETTVRRCLRIVTLGASQFPAHRKELEMLNTFFIHCNS